MLNTKSIRIIVNEGEKNLIESKASGKGYNTISGYVRNKIIKELIFKEKIKNIYDTLKKWR